MTAGSVHSLRSLDGQGSSMRRLITWGWLDQNTDTFLAVLYGDKCYYPLHPLPPPSTWKEKEKRIQPRFPPIISYAYLFPGGGEFESVEIVFFLCDVRFF